MIKKNLQVGSWFTAEKYTAFISPEACHASDKYLDFRREHGEQINKSSPLIK
ncbi:MAG: hypothetical protein ACJ71H_10185 [Nitrososphaeraceae archaeon]